MERYNHRLISTLKNVLLSFAIALFLVTGSYLIRNYSHDQDVQAEKIKHTHSCQYNCLMDYHKKLQNQKYITIDQLKHLVALHDKLVEHHIVNIKPTLFNKNGKLENDRSDREYKTTAKVINSYENSHVVDNKDGHEYMVQMTFNGFGESKNYQFTPVFDGKTAQVNKYWVSEHK